MNDYNAGQITRLCAGGQFIAATGITGAVDTHTQGDYTAEGLNQNGAAHKTKAIPKDRQWHRTKPVQDNHMSTITATCAGEEKELHLTICNQYVERTVWCSLIAVYDHFSAISRMHHAADNGAVRGYRAGLAPSIGTQNRTPRRQRMVTLAGQSQDWPVPFVPGISTSVNITAIFERENSSADSLTKTKEAANMATSARLQGRTSSRLNHNQSPLFVFLFAAVSRADLTDHTPHMVRIAAHDELTARRSLVGRYVLSFAGRIPVQEVKTHA